MNNSIGTVDLLRILPPALKYDPKMIAAAQSIGKELQRTSGEIRKNIIYARIDELDEETVDALAYDLHVDWYNLNYPLEAKRAVVKDSVRVHKRLGTLYAVKTALGSVYPESEIEEWFDYGGEHHRFRVVLDVTHSRAPADYVAIKKAVQFYKRLSAQMENMIYQCRVDVRILTDSDKYQHLAGYSGRRLAGTYPQRNTLAALIDAGVALMPDGGGVRFVSPAAGTRPQREISAALRESVIQASGEGVQFSFRATEAGKDRAGEKPNRNTGGAVQHAQITAQVAVDAYRHESPAAGTQPQRAVAAALRASAIQASGEGVQFSFRATEAGKDRAGEKPGRSTGGAVQRAQIAAQVAADAYQYESPEAGTQPHRNAIAAILSAGVTTYTTATAHGFISQQAGAQPGRSTTAEGERGGIIPEVTGEVFVYRVKRCGTDRCKDK